MKESPIMFRAPLVCAILSGHKSQTRRLMKTPPSGVHGLRLAPATCPYGQQGDRLWVKETWADVNLEGAPGIAYRADGDVRDLMEDRSFLDRRGAFNYDDPRYLRVAEGKRGNGFSVWSTDLIGEVEGRWRSSMLMPRWVARIVLPLVDVRAQRLQDITEEDALAEGITSEEVIVDAHCAGGVHQEVHGTRYFVPQDHAPYEDAIEAFAALWDSINGAGSWDANPWVWALTFRPAF